MSTDTQDKDLPIQTNFSATFKPSISVSGSQVELNINGVLGATVHGRGFTPNTELKGNIYMKPNIGLVPNSYLIATVGDSIVFLFRARDPSGPIIGGATFPNPFKAGIDWHGNLDWKNLVQPPSGVNGTELIGPGVPPAELWLHTPITIRVETGAVSRLVVASAAGHKGVLEIDSVISANPPFPVFLIGTLWYKPEIFSLEINTWQLIVKKPGGYYLTFAPAFEPNTLGYAHLDTINPIVPVPGDWYGNVIWVLDSEPLRPPESKEPITLSIQTSRFISRGPAVTVGNHTTDLPGLDSFFNNIMVTGDGVELDGWIHIDKPSLLFGVGTWDMQVHQPRVPPSETIFAVLTFYSRVLVHDTPLIVGQATFNGIFENPSTDNPPTEWSGEYSWRSTDPAIDPPKDTPTVNPPRNLPLTAEMTLVLPSVSIRFRQITANFGGWSAVLPDDFAKFFIYTPYEHPGVGVPKVVPGTLLYEPSLTGVKNRWKVETVHGATQAVMTLYSSLIGPILPIGFAIFNGKFPAGNWEGILEWKRRDEDIADEFVEAA